MSEHTTSRALTPAKPVRLPAKRERLRNRKLSRRQSRFVDAYLDTGVASQAAAIAGYPERSAAQRGHEQLQSPIVIEELHKRLEQRIKIAAPIGFKRLVALAETAESENVSLQASVALLDRAGYSVIRKVETSHTIDIRSDAELAQAAKALVEQLKDMNLHAVDAKAIVEGEFAATDVEAEQAGSSTCERLDE